MDLAYTEMQKALRQEVREWLPANVPAAPLARFGTRSTMSTGVVSLSNSPAACPAMAFWCGARANSSCASRVTFHCVATFSAVGPMP